MSRVSPLLKSILSHVRIAVLTIVAASVLATGAARADVSFLSSRGLQQALSTNEHVDLYNKPSGSGGFNIDSAYFSGYASGVTPPDSVADFNTNQRLYALLIDGRYDFNYDKSALASPVHPYLSGGMGMATTGLNNNLTTSQNNSTVVPMFRLGGGVAYRLDDRWNMSLDYKAGRASLGPSDQFFTGRSQQPVDLQALNLGMRYAF